MGDSGGAAAVRSAIEREHDRWQAPFENQEEGADDAGENVKQELNFYLDGKRRVSLYRMPSVTDGANETVEPYDSFKAIVEGVDSHSRAQWAVGVLELCAPMEFDTIVQNIRMDGKPLSNTYFIGKVGDSNKVIFMYKGVKGQPKTVTLDGATYHRESVGSGTGVARKQVGAFQMAMKVCSHYHTDMKICDATEGPKKKAEEGRVEKVLGVVLNWGMEKFRLFVEEARNRTKEEQSEEKFGVQGFDKVCATSAAFLMDHVNHKQNSDDYVYRVGSEKQKAACPGTYRDDVTDEFKTCKTYRFQPVTKNGRHTIELVESTVGEWKRGGEHMKSTLCVMGEGGLGISKPAHLTYSN